MIFSLFKTKFPLETANMSAIFDNGVCSIVLKDAPECVAEVFLAKVHVDRMKKDEFLQCMDALLALPDMPINGKYAQIIDLTEADIIPTTWIMSILDLFRAKREQFVQKLLCTVVIVESSIILKGLQQIIQHFYQPLKPLYIVKDATRAITAIQKLESKEVDLSNGEGSIALPNVIYAIGGDN